MGRETVTFDNQYYLVLYLDFVGLRQRLASVAKIPESKDEAEQFIRAFDRSVLRIAQWRELIENYFGTAPALPGGEVNINWLSDATAISVPLKDESLQYEAPVRAVHWAIFGTCGFCIMALMSEMPFRAGLDVEVGTVLAEGDVFGPALSRAYKLESQWADYPRVLIGSGVADYLDKVEANGNVGARAAAAACRSYVMVDTDGLLALDYLGRPFLSKAPAEIKEAVGPAEQFVRKSFEVFSRQGDVKHSRRYYRLTKYFEARLGQPGRPPMRRRKTK